MYIQIICADTCFLCQCKEKGQLLKCTIIFDSKMSPLRARWDGDSPWILSLS